MRGAAELAGWPAVDVGTVRALGSPDGRAILRSLPAYDEREVMRLQDRLRREGHSPDFVAALLTQQRLRARAVTKFGEFADDMLYTADGLEQASRLEVAATHAGRFYNASLATVHDLGCGIGSDAVAMSALGVTVQGVDVDPVTAAVADINLRPVAGLAGPGGARRGVRAAARPAARAGRRLARPGAARAGARPAGTGGSSGSSGSTRSGRRGSSCSRWPPRCPPPEPSSRPRCRTTPSPSAPRRSGPRSPARCSSARCGGARSPSARAAAPASSGRTAPPSRSTRRWPSRTRRRRVARRGRAVALRARPGGHPGRAARRRHRRDPRQRGRPRARVRRVRGRGRRAVRPALRRARGHALQREVAAGLAASSTASPG